MSQAHPSPAGQVTRRRRSKFLWFFMALQLLFVIWLVAALASSGSPPEDCGVLDAQTCQDASDAGTTVGVLLLVALWAFVDIIVGGSYAIYRLARRR